MRDRRCAIISPAGSAVGQTVATRQHESGSQFNHYWMLTDLDSGNPWQNQYVSAYYLLGNDEARDNNGTVLPDCP